MFRPIQFPNKIESLVRFVEETAPGHIIEATLAKLRGGISPKELLTAGALAVTRSTELPPEHHGGPVHPICGIHAVYETSQRLSGELALMPIVQHTSLCNKHVHSPQMGPYILPEIVPLESKGEAIASYHVGYSDTAPDVAYNGDKGNGLDATEEAFVDSIRTRKASAAEQYCLWLLENLPTGRVLDLLLPAAISRNNIDDHYFLFPMFTARALDCIGWEWAPVLMRPVVRYQARNPFALRAGGTIDFSAVEALLDEYKLLEIDIPPCTSEKETGAIGELASQIAACYQHLETIDPIAKALANGMSMEGAGEALSIGAATIYLSSSYGNPMDVHLHTGANTRRYLLKMEGVGLRNKLLALLTGVTGPECAIGEELRVWSPHPDSHTLATLPQRSQSELLAAISESIEDQPLSDWKITGVGDLIAPPEVQEPILLAQQYASKGYDPEALFVQMAGLICQDDFTEMHALKHHQAMVEEYYSTREPFCALHLVSAVKSAALILGGREHTVYQRARELLKT